MLKIVVERKELEVALERMKVVVQSKVSIPILACVRIAFDDTGRVRLTGTDLDTWVEVDVDANVDKAGVTVVNCASLSSLVKLLAGGGQCTITQDDEERAPLIVSQGRKSISLPTFDAGDFPSESVWAEPAAATFIDTKVFTSMWKRARIAVSKEEGHWQYHRALVEIKGSELRVVATDGHRLLYTAVEGTMIDGGAKGELVARAGDVFKGLNSSAKVTITAPVETMKDAVACTTITTEGVRLVMRHTGGNFPAYERVMVKDSLLRVTMSRKELSSAMKSALSAASVRTRAVALKAFKGAVELEAKDYDRGSYRETLEAGCSGAEPLEIALNAAFLLDYLTASSEERVELGFNGPDAPFTLRPPAGSGVDEMYVVMPIRG